MQKESNRRRKDKSLNSELGCDEGQASRLDFSWILFVGTKMLGFTEREVGHMTLKKWNLLYKHFRVYHNFCTQQQLFKEEKVQASTNDEWLPD